MYFDYLDVIWQMQWPTNGLQMANGFTKKLFMTEIRMDTYWRCLLLEKHFYISRKLRSNPDSTTASNTGSACWVIISRHYITMAATFCYLISEMLFIKNFMYKKYFEFYSKFFFNKCKWLNNSACFIQILTAFLVINISAV